MIAALFLVVASCPVLDLGAEPGTDAPACPTRHLVRAAEAEDHRLDLVFLPEGWVEDDFRDYACAVERTARSLLSQPPWSEFACRVNVWRIDLHDPDGIQKREGCVGTPAKGSGLCAQAGQTVSSGTDAPEPGSIEGDVDCSTADFGLERCGTGLWPRNPGAASSLAKHLAACTGNALPVILANEISSSGGGSRKYEFAISSIGALAYDMVWMRVAHELSHALGLFDEYGKYGEHTTQEPYVFGRNVAREEDLSLPGHVPWCAQLDGIDGDPEGCRIVRSDRCGPQGEFIDGVGLWEGAWGQNCRYFRSQGACRMGDNLADPYCGVCLDQFDRAMALRGVAPCDGSWTPGPTLTLLAGDGSLPTFLPPDSQELARVGVVSLEGDVTVSLIPGVNVLERDVFEVPGRMMADRVIFAGGEELAIVPGRPFGTLVWRRDGVETPVLLDAGHPEDQIHSGPLVQVVGPLSGSERQAWQVVIRTVLLPIPDEVTPVTPNP